MIRTCKKRLARIKIVHMDKQLPIFDGILIANEVIHIWKQNKENGVILKLDFEKAYDCVNWNFLWDMVTNFGFGRKWNSWILERIATVSFSVLINGSPTPEFNSERGLRLGDPLSPFLFNMVVEALNLILERAREAGTISGVQVGSDGQAKWYLICNLQMTPLSFATMVWMRSNTLRIS